MFLKLKKGVVFLKILVTLVVSRPFFDNVLLIRVLISEHQRDATIGLMTIEPLSIKDMALNLSRLRTWL